MHRSQVIPHKPEVPLDHGKGTVPTTPPEREHIAAVTPVLDRGRMAKSMWGSLDLADRQLRNTCPRMIESLASSRAHVLEHRKGIKLARMPTKPS